jgi:hippurate hydrolase
VVRIERGPPPVVNPAAQAEVARTAATRALGEGAVVPFGITNMAGEDFAFYQERIPGCFMRVGAREEGEEKTAAHSPRFTSAEGCIMVGAAVLAECAREAGRRAAKPRVD